MELAAKLEQGLRDIYYNPKTGYQSSERSYKEALEDGLNVNRKLVKEWLKSQDTCTRYKPVVRNISLERHMLITLMNKLKWI